MLRIIVEPPSAADEAIDRGTPVALDTSTVEEHDVDEDDGDCAGEPTESRTKAAISQATTMQIVTSDSHIC